MNPSNALHRESPILTNTKPLAWINDVKEMMRNARTFLGTQLTRRDIQAAKHLSRVGIDNFSIQSLCKRHRHMTLAYRSRADKTQY
jgi:hypothetical protein